MLKKIRIILTLFLLGLSTSSWAILHLVLTQGVDSAIPLGFVTFSQPGTMPSTNVSQVIQADLSNSGQFKIVAAGDSNHQPHQPSDVQLSYWQKQNADYLIIGSVSAKGVGEYQVKVSLLNLFKHNTKGANPALKNQAPVLLSKTFTVQANQLRNLAHTISNVLYQKLLGERGIFRTKITYVVLQRPANKPPLYQLMVADYDGFNQKPILQSKQPIISPAWSPNGQKIAYVSFESGLPAIYISNIHTGKRQLITKFPGINGAPAFSPDGSKLAVVLSKGHNPNIYIVNLVNGKLRQLTHSYAIDTEPSWAPDGDSLLFTSDGGGSPQVYQLNVQTRKIKRLTFSGNYNAHASFAPGGQSIVLLHRGEDTNGQFGVGLLYLQSGVIQVLSVDNDQSPSMSPNGNLIIYATENQQGQSTLAMVSRDGRAHLQLPARNGSVREPVWSPYLTQGNA